MVHPNMVTAITKNDVEQRDEKYFENKLALQVFMINGGMTLHIMQNWSVKKICNYVDNECTEWSTRTQQTMLAYAFDVTEFGENKQPLRSFDRDSRGKWIEVKPRHYSEEWFAAKKDAIKRAIDHELAHVRGNAATERKLDQ